jgi:SAM-dependent methyltransferase
MSFAALLEAEMLPRVLEPETLDQLAADDPVAQRSRRDLRRVNAFMGARRILARAMARALADAPARPLRILELGCGDGRLMLEVARRRGDRWPEARLDLLDRQPIVDAATIAAYAAAGWQAQPVIADVMDWAVDDGEHWDLIVANLFLHHFDGDELRRLLMACGRRADALAACEPRRSRFALAASHLIFFLGANAVTRHDGVLSVRAGFVGRELASAWPEDAAAWRVQEYDDGLFTHCLVASRRRSPS